MEKIEFERKIREYLCNETKIDLTELQVNQFFIFMNYLIEQNKLFNLTSIVEEEKIIIKHFLDSLEIVESIKNIDDGTKTLSFIDVGTGAGFPAVPLSIVFPEHKFCLLDSLNKRIKFLSEVKNILGLKNVELVCGRAEELGNDKKYREQFDIATSRAVAKLNILAEFVSCFVKKSGRIFLYKTYDSIDEYIEAKHSLNEMQLVLKREITYTLPLENAKRKIYLLEKTNELDSCYPRRMATIKKKPL